MATTSPTTTFSGLASGIDSASIIKSMMSIANQPVTRLQAKQTVNTTMSRKFTDIKTKMTALQTAAKTLDTRTEAMVSKVSSTDEKVAKVTTAGGASLGSFDVQVISVAKAERTYSDGVSSSDASGLFGNGTLNIQVGANAAVGINVTNTDTLSSVAGKINAANAGVTAGIVYDGTNYRLQVSGNESGAANAISFGEAGGLTLGLSKLANQFQAASDAVVKVDGLTVSSAKNDITSAIPGVTISVVGMGTTSLKVDRDPEGLKTKLDSFVKAYNDVMTAINTEFAFSGTQKAAGSLSGDSSLRSAQTDLRSLVTQSLGDLTSDTFGSVGALGITVQRDGTLSVDSAKLTKAVNENYEGVTAALVGNGTLGGLMSQVVDTVDPYTRADGTFTSRITNLAARNRDIDTQVSRMQTRLDKYEEQLTRQYSQLESLMGSLQSQSASLSAMLTQ